MENILNKGPTTIRKLFAFMAVLLVLVLPSFMFFAQDANATGTAAGQLIQNRATAEYTDAADPTNTVLTSTSNQVTTEVLPRYVFTITPNGTVGGPPFAYDKSVTAGGIVTNTYILQNTSNTPDTYNINVAYLGSTLAIQNVHLYAEPLTGATNPGVPDAAEEKAINFNTGTVTVAADNSARLFVVFQASPAATAGQIAFVNVVGTSQGAAALLPPQVVTDNDNVSRTTLTDDAVVDFSKTVDKGSANPNDTLRYDIDMKNNGNAPARNISFTDNIPAGSLYQISPPASFSGGVGTITYWSGPNGTGSQIGAPADNSGSSRGTDSNVMSIKFESDPLAVTNNVTVTFYVKVNANITPASDIRNTIITHYATTAAPAVDIPGSFGPIITTINTKTAVYITAGAPGPGQTATSATPANSDGIPVEDTNHTDAVTQTSVAAGQTINFQHIIVNRGNATDVFELTNVVTGQALPNGTQIGYTYLNGLDITDSNGNTPDVTVGPNSSLTILVKVTIPPNAPATTVDSIITTTATSTIIGTPFGAGAGYNTSDNTRSIVSAITAASVDITNIIDGTILSDGPVTLVSSANAVGTSVTYPLNVKNSGSLADIFILSLDGASTTPAGSVVSFASVGARTTGSGYTANSVNVTDVFGIAVNNTIVIGGQSLTVASVSTSGHNPGTITFTQTLFDTTPPNNTVVKVGSAITQVNLGPNGSPTDNLDVVAIVTVPLGTAPTVTDYDLYYKATSNNNPAANDIVLDHLNVPSFTTYVLSSNNTATMPRGGTVFYNHSIQNTGNTDEFFTINVPSPSATSTAGLLYQLLAANGVTTLGNGNSVSGVTIPPNGSFAFQVKVSAPVGALLTSEMNIISATETSVGGVSGTNPQTNTDTTTVIAGLINLNKSVDKPSALPGEVLTYTIKYRNVGPTTARNVIVSDIIPTNTTIVNGSLKFSPVVGGPFTDASAFAEVIAGTVKFYVGSGGSAATDTGGDVPSLTEGYVQFQVTID
jgi:uncharacterized repeat protein (TIGR01451 family)